MSNCLRLAVTETGRTGIWAGAADVAEILELLGEVIDLLGGVLCYFGGYGIKREMLRFYVKCRRKFLAV